MRLRTNPLPSRLLIVLSSCVVALAFAQAPASPSPASATTLLRPTHSCVKPGPTPGRLATTNQIKNYNAEVRAYQDCLQTFVKAQGELVKLHTEIGNAAVNEYNAFVTEMTSAKDASAK